MKFVFSFLLVFVVAAAHAEKLPAFAKTERIVTVAQWGWRDATVWAIQKDRLVVYKVFDTSAADELLAEIPLKKDQIEKIRKAVNAIPQEVRGRVHLPRGVMDGSMLCLSFTEDGHRASDRIEVQNLWFPWLADTLQAISDVSPEDLKIRFKEVIEEADQVSGGRMDRPVRSIPIDEYYKVSN